MRIFITGATGWIGSAITDELLANGYEVLGLARSDAGAGKLETKGAQVHRGDLDDADALIAGAKDADGVIHLAMDHSFTDTAASWRREHDVAKAMLDSLVGTGKPFLIASGLILGVEGRAATEDDPSPFVGPDSMRGGSENLALSYADMGVRPVALRFGATTHGMRDHGFVATLKQIAQQRGVVGYLGEGDNTWPAVHVADAARVARLALEKAPAGFAAHAVGEEGIAMRDIAAALGARYGLPTASIAAEDAAEHFGWMARFVGASVRATATKTQETLGWTPTGPTLFEDIEAGAYDEA